MSFEKMYESTKDTLKRAEKLVVEFTDMDKSIKQQGLIIRKTMKRQIRKIDAQIMEMKRYTLELHRENEALNSARASIQKREEYKSFTRDEHMADPEIAKAISEEFQPTNPIRKIREISKIKIKSDLSNTMKFIANVKKNIRNNTKEKTATLTDGNIPDNKRVSTSLSDSFLKEIMKKASRKNEKTLKGKTTEREFSI